MICTSGILFLKSVLASLSPLHHHHLRRVFDKALRNRNRTYPTPSYIETPRVPRLGPIPPRDIFVFFKIVRILPGNDITGTVMPVVATPELGIPFPFDTTPEELNDFRAKAEALLNTVEVLESEGLSVEVTDDDRMQSHEIMLEEKLPPPRDLTPASVKHLNTILTEFDRELFDVHRRLRNYVTNKLVIESTDEDAKVRLKALELLGKVSGVGLFSERIDVNVTHRTVKDIEDELKKTLQLYEGEYNVVDEDKPVALAEIDLDEELGLNNSEEDLEDGSEPTS